MKNGRFPCYTEKMDEYAITNIAWKIFFFMLSSVAISLIIHFMGRKPKNLDPNYKEPKYKTIASAFFILGMITFIINIFLFSFMPVIVADAVIWVSVRSLQFAALIYVIGWLINRKR